jgi:hypothetical protein
MILYCSVVVVVVVVVVVFAADVPDSDDQWPYFACFSLSRSIVAVVVMTLAAVVVVMIDTMIGWDDSVSVP